MSFYLDAVSLPLPRPLRSLHVSHDSLGLVFIFDAVGTSSAGFPHEGHRLELNPRETQPTPGLAHWGLQPGRLPRCPGGPPQREWQVGGNTRPHAV